MEDKIKEVKQKFDSLRGRLQQTEEERISVMRRREEAERKLSALREECDTIRVERQRILADGGDSVPISKKLKNIEEEVQLLTEEIHGLKSKIENLIQLGGTLQNQISTERAEVAKVKIIDLSRQYNKMCEVLAPVVKALMRCKNDLEGSDHIAWAAWDAEIFRKIPRISFEPNEYDFFYHRDRDGI